LLLLLSTKTFIRNQEWHDSFMLTTSALRTNPGNAKIHFSMGNELAQKGNRSCEEFYKEALRLKPDYTLALVNLGLVYLNTGRPKEAEQSYKKALSIKPDHINANTNMGHFYRLQKRWKEALTHYKQALRRRPDSPIFHYYIAWMYGELNEVEVRGVTIAGLSSPVIVFLLFPCRRQREN
jgi:tetratricopeptide (TPR) repeat protein